MGWVMLVSSLFCLFNMIYCAFKSNHEAVLAWFTAMLFAVALTLRNFAS